MHRRNVQLNARLAIPLFAKPLAAAVLYSLALATAALTAAAPAAAQSLPPHPPLRILIVSDEVNPHGLPPEDLTQPGELTTALLAEPQLRLDTSTDAVNEIATNDLEEATALLELPSSDPSAYDVLIYFAHRIPNGATGPARQEAFVTAVDGFLSQGGGVVSFHHGIYRTAGKESMQALLGGEATGAVLWNTTVGQNVIAVSPDHFVARYALSYASTVSYQDPANGIPLASYPTFNNTPDEHYPNLALLPPAGGTLTALFASDFGASTHLLGWLQTRPSWSGALVVYQPGEYQPHALEPGPNYQILLNAIVFTARYAEGELLFGDSFESGDLTLWATVVGGS